MRGCWGSACRPSQECINGRHSAASSGDISVGALLISVEVTSTTFSCKLAGVSAGTFMRF